MPALFVSVQVPITRVDILLHNYMEQRYQFISTLDMDTVKFKQINPAEDSSDNDSSDSSGDDWSVQDIDTAICLRDEDSQRFLAGSDEHRQEQFDELKIRTNLGWVLVQVTYTFWKDSPNASFSDSKLFKIIEAFPSLACQSANGYTILARLLAGNLNWWAEANNVDLLTIYEYLRIKTDVLGQRLDGSQVKSSPLLSDQSLIKKFMNDIIVVQDLVAQRNNK